MLPDLGGVAIPARLVATGPLIAPERCVRGLLPVWAALLRRCLTAAASHPGRRHRQPYRARPTKDPCGRADSHGGHVPGNSRQVPVLAHWVGLTGHLAAANGQVY